jgi:DNA-directed RNA polymerase specialized sigma24 family protein
MTLAEAIQSVDMDEIIDRMNAYAISRLKSVGAKSFDGRSPVDFVGDLILKVMEGERDWAKAECSFKEFLFGCLKSDISNFFRTLKHKHTNELPEIPVSGISLNIDGKRSQVSELLKQKGADDDELMVFEYWMDGIFKPAEIAADLGAPVEGIYVIIKRLERKRKKIEQQAINII